MRTEKQIQASRANGARSRGPVTPEGKAISSRNATRHGLLAKTIVLSTEDRAEFVAVFEALASRFNPADDFEMNMIDEMCAAFWRLRRSWTIETGILEAAIGKLPPSDPFDQTAAAFSEAAQNGPLALNHRYEARLNTIYQRAIKNLILYRKHSVLPNEPNSPASQPSTHAVLPNEPKLFLIPAAADPISARGVPQADTANSLLSVLTPETSYLTRNGDWQASCP